MKKHSQNRRGSAMTLAIIVSIVLTGLVASLAWTCGMLMKSTATTSHYDATSFVAEAIEQQVIWQLKHNSMWRPTGATTPATAGTMSFNSRSYAYTLSCAADGANPSALDVSVQATDTAANTSARAVVTVTPTWSGPVLASSGQHTNPTFTLAGNTTINGNVTTHGNVTVTSGSTVTINGSLKANGTITAGYAGATDGEFPSYATNLTQSTNATAIYTTLAAGSKVTISNTATTLDFTSSPNGVLYVSGAFDLGKVTKIIGTGTLVSSDDINITTNQVGTPSAPLKINIVAKMDFNPAKNFYIQGGIYCDAHFDFTHISYSIPPGLNWSITGNILVDQDILFKNGNTGTITNAPPPSFDTRSSSGGSLSVSNYSDGVP